MDHTSHDYVEENATVRKHGIGKGLMTVWRVLNPNRRGVSPYVDLLDERATLSHSSAHNPPHKKKKQRQLASILVFLPLFIYFQNYGSFYSVAFFLLKFLPTSIVFFRSKNCCRRGRRKRRDVLLIER